MANINTGNAICALGTSETAVFQDYISKCRTSADVQRGNNIFTFAESQFKDNFQNLRAEYDNLIISGNSISDMANLTGYTNDAANSQLNTLQKKKDMLLAEIKALRSQAEAYDRNFMDLVMEGGPKKEAAPSLQDLSLLLFWFAWLVMVVTLVAIRWGSPDGSWKAGVFVFILLLIVTLCLYALMRQIV